MTKAIAKQKYVRASPKKLVRIARLLKNKNVKEAMSMLKFHPSKSSIPLYKAIKSAAANLKNKMEAEAPEDENIIIETIKIDKGPMYKRLNIRARGRADITKTKTSHITVEVLTEK